MILSAAALAQVKAQIAGMTTNVKIRISLLEARDATGFQALWNAKDGLLAGCETLAKLEPLIQWARATTSNDTIRACDVLALLDASATAEKETR
jgi:hypothetical protein